MSDEKIKKNKKVLQEIIEYSQLSDIVPDFESIIDYLLDEGLEIKDTNYGKIWRLIAITTKNRRFINWYENNTDESIKKFFEKLRKSDKWSLLVEATIKKPEDETWLRYKELIQSALDRLENMGYYSYFLPYSASSTPTKDEISAQEKEINYLDYLDNCEFDDIRIGILYEASKLNENIITKFKFFK